MTTTSNIRSFIESKWFRYPAGIFCIWMSGFINGHDSMKHECASIMTANLPIPPVSIIYLSRGDDGKTPNKAFLEWVQKQPSCISGGFSEYVDGEGRNPACHVRRAKDSGTAYKPKFRAVSMTHEEHARQHKYGEADCLSYFMPKPNREWWGVAEAKEWFNEQADKSYKNWLKT